MISQLINHLQLASTAKTTIEDVTVTQLGNSYKITSGYDCWNRYTLKDRQRISQNAVVRQAVPELGSGKHESSMVNSFTGGMAQQDS